MATGLSLPLVATPGKVQRCVQCQALGHDLGLLEMDEGRVELQVRLGFGAQVGGGFKGFQEDLAAIGIAAAVFLHEPHEDVRGLQHFSPAHGRGQQVPVAKGHVAHGHALAMEITFGQGDACVGQGRAANLAQVLETDHQAMRLGHRIEIRDVVKGPAFAGFGELAVVRVQ